jgi:hypothetical protein
MSTTRSHTANSRSVGFQQSAGSQQSANIFGINLESFQQNVDRANLDDSGLHNIPPCSIVGGVQADSLVIDLRSVLDEDSNLEYDEDAEWGILTELAPELVQQMELSEYAEQADEDAMELSEYAGIAAEDD